MITNVNKVRVVPSKHSAVHYLDIAGEEALRTYACREAVEFLTEALSLSERLPTKPSALQRGRWERRLGVAYMGLGQMEKSRSYHENSSS